jgi:uncharacterized protein DUF695
MPEKVHARIPRARYAPLGGSRDGMPVVLIVNQALLDFPHRKVFPWHLKITIEAKAVAENGMPTAREVGILERVCDKLESAILRGRNEYGANNAIFLARSTGNGLRELMFQVHGPEVTHSTLQLRLKNRRPVREWAYEMFYDARWKDAVGYFKVLKKAKKR